MSENGTRASRDRLVVAALILLAVGAGLFIWSSTWDEDASREELDANGDVGDRRRGGAAGDGFDGENSDGAHSAPESTLRAPIRMSAATSRDDATAAHGALAGTVIDWSSGGGVPSAELSFESLGRTLAVRADAHGVFLFEPPDEGTYVLALALAEGYLPYAPELGMSPIAFVATGGQRVEGAAVYLVPALDYVGLVVDAEGEPVANAAVRLLGTLAEQSLIPLETSWTTSVDGTFTFHAPDGVLFEATHPERGRGRAPLDFGAQTSHRLTITLRRERDEAVELGANEHIAGSVEGPDGQPLPDAWVRAEIEVDNRASAGANLHPWVRGSTDADGRFDLRGLDPGRYRVIAQADGYASAAVDDVRAGTEDVVVRLGEERVLRGVVVDRETGVGVAASAIVVERALSSLERASVATASTYGADGRFEVRRLPAGHYVVTATAQGYAPADEVRVVLDAGGTSSPLSLALGRGGTVAGVVTSGEGGAPIERARVSLEGRLGGGGSSAVPLVRSATTSHDGRFEIEGVPSGPQSLFVAGAHHHARLISGIVVGSGARVELTVDLTPTEGDEEPRVELAGLGVVITAQGEELLIGRTIEGGGAAEAGLGEGDAILAVDGAPVAELGFQGSIEKMRGPEGSSVTLTVRRAATHTIEELSVPRRRIRA